MNGEDRFAELWTDYLEGELDEAGIAELRSLLAADDGLLKRATDLYQSHRLLGLIAAEEATRHEQFVRDTLARLPENGDRFTSGVMQQIGKSGDQRKTSSKVAAAHASEEKTRRTLVGRGGWIVAGLALAALFVVWLQSGRSPIPGTDQVNNQDGASQPAGEQPAGDNDVRFASLAHARFFGELSPSANSALTPNRDYVLMGGLVELAFPRGASAIIEGPAVFRVLSEECLALDVGRCSVHAPDGAEGFRVETPVTRVVDRGTRFTVNVNETSETEVQVVEGAADVYRHNSQAAPEVQLTEQQAQRFVHNNGFTAQSTDFDSAAYRRQLPDRVVSYTATTANDGGAQQLRSVSVQRNGREINYAIDQLIPVDLIWFKSNEEQDRNGHFAGPEQLSESRIDVLSDAALNTGVINPGGGVLPLASDPVLLTGESSTPGMAVRFRRPVINGPGPDFVLFELQTVSNSPDGDAFHVSPLSFAAGRKSHTINTYDLTLMSPEALKLSGFYLYKFDTPIASLAELQSKPFVQTPVRLNFRALAVGVDLSDLGYQPGEEVDGVFLQDAQDDDNLVDPTYIGGLP